MKNPVTYILPVVIGLLCFSCAPLYYAPNAHNVPLLTHKGEATLNVAASSGLDEVEGFELQGATALTNHFGVMGNFYAASGAEPGDGSGKGALFEAAGGYYTPIPTSVASAMEGRWVFSAFAGGGGGTVKNYYDADKTSSSKRGFNRVFIQPAFGLKTTYFDAVVSLRVANLHFHSAESGNAGQPYYYQYRARTIDILRRDPSYLLWEPALTLRAGWKFIKLQTQFGLSINHTDSNFAQENMNVNVGLCLDLFPDKKLFRGKKEAKEAASD